MAFPSHRTRGKGVRARRGARRKLLGLSFDAFHDYHRRLWMRYAHTQVGSRPAAERGPGIAPGSCRRAADASIAREFAP